MYVDHTSETKAVICTLPRSGTNLVEYFMKYLGFFLFAKQKDWDSEECVFDSVRCQKTINPLAPSPFNWPGYFELFLSLHNYEQHCQQSVYVNT